VFALTPKVSDMTANDTTRFVTRGPNGRFQRGSGPATQIIGAEGVSQAMPPRVEPRTAVASPIWSEPVYRTLLNMVPDWVFVIEGDGTVLYAQGPSEGELHGAVKNFAGKRIIELLPAQLAQQARYYLEKTLRTGQSQTFTTQFVLRGKECQFQARAAVCAPGQVIALVREISERHLREKEILEISNREQLRIGQDLHDGLGQHLTGITFLTRALESKLAGRGLPEAAEVGEIGKLVLQALTQTRNLARGLFPVEVETHGLVQALKELTITAEKMFKISCRFEGEETLVIRNRTVSHHLFRVAQEAINNSVKHGKASQVVLSLSIAGENLQLAVRDNGLGFSADKTQSQGLGLRIMAYRAQKIGGTLHVVPGEGGGTLVTCSFKTPPEEL
jgi:signal transduction histidine kinase